MQTVFHTSVEFNHVLYYIGVSALVLVGLIVAASAFVAIFASIRNSRAEFAEAQESAAEQILTKAEEQASAEAEGQATPEGEGGTSTNHDDVETKKVEEQ